MHLSNEPSAVEFDGYYNVQKNARNRDRGHITTVSKPPPLTLEEVQRFASRIYEVIFQFANLRYYSKEEVRNYYDQCIGISLEDRTLGISFIEPDDCTIGLLKECQKVLATEYPLWRIRVGGSSPKTVILVYPKSIRYGAEKYSADEETALANVLQMESISRNKSPLLDQQRQVLKSAMPVAIEEGVGDNPVIVGKFNNYKGDFSQCTLWALCSKAVADVRINFPAEYMNGDRFYVKQDGDYGYHVGEGAPYWVREWIFAGNKFPTHLSLTLYDLDYQTRQLDLDIE